MKTHRVNEDELNPKTECGLDVLGTSLPLARFNESPSCDECFAKEIATDYFQKLDDISSNCADCGRPAGMCPEGCF
jgi:hypothetical protein